MLSRVGTFILDLSAGLVCIAALGLSYLMLRNAIAWLFIDPRVVVTPRVAFSVLAVVAMTTVAPIATAIHWRTAARAGTWVSLGAALLGEAPAEVKKYRAWWWGRLAASAWIVGFISLGLLIAW